jgi:hypothetical protein
MQAQSSVAQSSEPQKRSCAKQIKLIREAFSAIPDMADGFRDVRSYLFDRNLAAERQHRKGAPYGIRHGITSNLAAKLFTVSHLLDGWAEPNKWTADDLLHVRTEVLYAQAYAKKFHAELAEWAAKYAKPFAEVDYSALMKGAE